MLLGVDQRCDTRHKARGHIDDPVGLLWRGLFLAGLSVQQKTGTRPARLELTQLDAPTVGAFLEHLETERGNSARTRNLRLAAVHSFFNYCALRHPEHAALIARVLAIPTKRSEKRIVTFLTNPVLRTNSP